MSQIFLRPYFSLIMIPLAILILLAWLKPKQNQTWSRLIDKELLAFLLPGKHAQHQRSLLLFCALTWFVACLALIGPSLSKRLMPQEKQLTPRVILLDLSSNMQKQDLAPSRLARAKFKIQDFVQSAPESEISLSAFTEEPFLVTPFTEDKKTILNLLERLKPELMPIDGSNIQKALRFAETLFQRNQMQSGEVLIVTGSIPNQADLDLAARLKQQKIHTSVLGIGEDTQLPHRAYRSLARAGGGHYHAIEIDNKDILSLIQQNSSLQKLQSTYQGYQAHDDGYYLVFIIMLLVLLGFRKGIFEQVIKS